LFKTEGRNSYYLIQDIITGNMETCANIVNVSKQRLLKPIEICLGKDCGFFGCETWSLTLREENRLRVFESRVLRRIFGPKRDLETGGWRKLHNEELHNLYSSPSIIRVVKSRRMRWARHVARMGEKRSACRILVRKAEGKKPCGRPRRRWVDNIKMDLREIGFGLMWLRIGTSGRFL
jgi:hypothetical protein